MDELSPITEVVLSSDMFDDVPPLENMSAPALAVLDAYMTGFGWLDSPTKKDCRGVAATLRATAKCLEKLPESTDYSFWCSSQVAGIDRGIEKLLAIADELEGLN